jgi:hypothetical protein
MWELQNHLSHTLFNLWLWASLTHYIKMQRFQNSVWCTCLWRHDAHAHAIWCSWCMLAWLSYPQNELVIVRAINELKRSVCVVSRILTTKIPSAPLGVITWLQHTWCPRFRRGTIGYGITPHQNIREIRVWALKSFMSMHVSSPNAPTCMRYAMRTQKWHLF